MNGFVAIVSLNGNTIRPLNIKWKKNFDFQSDTLIRTWSNDKFFIEQKIPSRMIDEKFWLDTEDFLFVTDGVILNIDKLKEREKVTATEELIECLFQRKETFFEEFEGSFVGIFYEKHTHTWYAFNNQTGTKKLFYFKNEEFLIFSTDLYVLCNVLISLHINYTLDELAAYVLLTGGFMLDNLTLISEVKQLRAGEYLRFDTNINLDFYFHLRDIKPNKDSKSDILYTLDTKFKEAVKLEFDMDLKHRYGHFCTLSGGLDSRMTTLIGYKMGYENIMLFNFSNKGYADEIIATQIADSYDLKMINRVISPESLTKIDDVVRVNDGLTIFTACSHVFGPISELKYLVGSVHTGMIGDAVLGSFVTSTKGVMASVKDGLYGLNIRYDQVKSYIWHLINEYPSEELYKFYNRAFMGANNGYLFLDLIGETTSPFLNTDFLSYAYSIPLEYKYKERVYIDWIKAYYPDAARFTWEAIGGKPTNNVLLRSFYRYKRAVIKRMPVKTMWKDNMNPEQLWYDENMNVKVYLDSYFYDNVVRITDAKLRNDVLELYKEKSIDEKAKCITLVAAIKLLFA